MSEHFPILIMCSLAAFFLWGVGYMTTQAENRLLEFKKHCIESDMQYISGDCVR